MRVANPQEPPVVEMTDEEVEAEFKERLHLLDSHEEARPTRNMPHNEKQ